MPTKIRKSVEIVDVDLGERELFLQNESYGTIQVKLHRYKEITRTYYMDRHRCPHQIISEETAYSNDVLFYFPLIDSLAFETGKEIPQITLRHLTNPHETIHIRGAILDQISNSYVLFASDKNTHMGKYPFFHKILALTK